ncbi:MAG: M6 family metalloprotease domain-containing protein, partial [Victivallales bacterium]|nr:M6 family metalloprotease domain-containing protein [Victivallales bacterium]
AAMVSAAPPAPGVHQYRQPDGTMVGLTLHGNERLHYYRDTDGYTVLFDPASKAYVYAERDVAGQVVAGARRVGVDNPTRAGLIPNLVPAARAVARGAASIAAPILQIGADNPYKVDSIGTMRNLVILVDFADMASTRTKADFEALFNDPNYTVDGAAGSVRDYYLASSYGQLVINSTVTDWITMDNSYQDYDETYGDVRAMVSEALQKLDDSGFDFSTMDGDGDGWVDGLTIIHAGFGEDAGALDPYVIWSHYWAMSSPVTYDGVTMQPYHTEPELRNVTGTDLVRIGVICHETGHFLGLPDLYDYGSDSSGAGNYCLMAAGSWNGGNSYYLAGRQPALHSAWCKYVLGWVTPTDLAAGGTFTLDSIATNQSMGMIRGSSWNPNEYFLVENRQAESFDGSLPGTQRGFLIWHVDENQPNNDDQTHYLVDLEEADGVQELELYNGYSGGDSDYFRNGNNNAFTGASNPSSASYAASPLGYDITSISASGASMTLNVSGGLGTGIATSDNIFEIAPQEQDARSDAALFQDADGVTHAAYVDRANMQVKYAQSAAVSQGVAWTDGVVASSHAYTYIDRPQIVGIAGGTVHIVFGGVDTSGQAKIFHTYSTDGGETWRADTPLSNGEYGASNPYLHVVTHPTDPEQNVLHILWAGSDTAACVFQAAELDRLIVSGAVVSGDLGELVEGNGRVAVYEDADGDGAYTLGEAIWVEQAGSANMVYHLAEGDVNVAGATENTVATRVLHGAAFEDDNGDHLYTLGEAFWANTRAVRYARLAKVAGVWSLTAGPVEVEGDVIPATLGKFHCGRLAVDSAGDVHAAYFAGAAAGNAIHERHMDGSTRVWGAVAELAPLATATPVIPGVAISGGRKIVVSNEQRQATPTETLHVVWLDDEDAFHSYEMRQKSLAVAALTATGLSGVADQEVPISSNNVMPTASMVNVDARPDKYGNLHLLYQSSPARNPYYLLYSARYRKLGLSQLWSDEYGLTGTLSWPVRHFTSLAVGPHANMLMAIDVNTDFYLVDPAPRVLGVEEFDMDESGAIDALTVTTTEDMDDSTISLAEKDQLQWTFAGFFNNCVNFDSTTDVGGVTLEGTSDPVAANDNVFTAVTDNLSIYGTAASSVRFVADAHRFQDFAGSAMESDFTITEHDRAGAVPYETFQHDTNGNGIVDVIVVHFSENIDHNSFDLTAAQEQFRIAGAAVVAGLAGSSGSIAGVPAGVPYTFGRLPQFRPYSSYLANGSGIIDPGTWNDDYITLFSDDWSAAVRNTNTKEVVFSTIAGRFRDHANPANDGVGQTVTMNHDYAAPTLEEALQLDGGRYSPYSANPDGFIDDVVLTYSEAMRDMSFYNNRTAPVDPGNILIDLTPTLGTELTAFRWWMGLSTQMTAYDRTTSYGAAGGTPFDTYFDPHRNDDEKVTIMHRSGLLALGTDAKSMRFGQYVRDGDPYQWRIYRKTDRLGSGPNYRQNWYSSQASSQLMRFEQDFPDTFGDTEYVKLISQYNTASTEDHQLITGVTILAVSGGCIWVDTSNGTDEDGTDSWSRIHQVDRFVATDSAGANPHTFRNFPCIQPLFYDPSTGRINWGFGYGGTNYQVSNLSGPQIIKLNENSVGGMVATYPPSSERFIYVYVDPAKLPKVDATTGRIVSYFRMFDYGINEFMGRAGRHPFATLPDVPVIDGADPFALDSSFFDTDGDGMFDEVVVQFSEPLDDATVNTPNAQQFGLDLNGDGVVDVYFDGVDDITDPANGMLTLNTLDPQVSPFSDVAVNPGNWIYLSDTGNQRIGRYGLNGALDAAQYLKGADTDPMRASKGVAYVRDEFPLSVANVAALKNVYVAGTEYTFVLDPVAGQLRKILASDAQEQVGAGFPLALNVAADSLLAASPDTADGRMYLVVRIAGDELMKIDAATGDVLASTTIAGITRLAALDDMVFYATGVAVGKLSLADLTADAGFGVAGEVVLTSIESMVATPDGLFLAANNSELHRRSLTDGAQGAGFPQVPANVGGMHALAVNSTQVFVSYFDTVSGDYTLAKYDFTGSAQAFASQPLATAPITRLIVTDADVFAYVPAVGTITKMGTDGNLKDGSTAGNSPEFGTAGVLGGVGASLNLLSRTRVVGQYYLLMSDLAQATKTSYSAADGSLAGLDVLYVADAGGNTVRKFRVDGTSEGTEVRGNLLPMTGESVDDYGFGRPYDVVVDSHGWVFVLDRQNDRIGRFFSDGTAFDAPGVPGADFIRPSATAVFAHPTALAIDANDRLYVADTGSDSVRVFETTAPWTQNDPTEVMSVSTVGAAALIAPCGVAVAPDGSVVYVADGGNTQVIAFTTSSYDAPTSSADMAAGYPLTEVLSNPTSVTLDSASDTLYVVEAGSEQARNRVGIYTASTGAALNEELFGLVAIGNNDGYVTLHISDDLALLLQGILGTGRIDDPITIIFNPQTGTWSDLVGNELDTSPEEVIDYADPQISRVELFDTNRDGDINEVAVTFSEDLNKQTISTLNAAQFTVRGMPFTHVDDTTDGINGLAPDTTLVPVDPNHYAGQASRMVLFREPEMAGIGSAKGTFAYVALDGSFQDTSGTASKSAEELGSVVVRADKVIDLAPPLPVRAVLSPWPVVNGRLVEQGGVLPYLDVTFSENVSVMLVALTNAQWTLVNPLGDTVSLGDSAFSVLDENTVRITFNVDATGSESDGWIDGTTINLVPAGSYAIQDFATAPNSAVANSTPVPIEGLADSTLGTPEFVRGAALDVNGNGYLDKIVVWLDDQLMTAGGHNKPDVGTFTATDADGTSLTITDVTVARNRVEVLLADVAGTTGPPTLAYNASAAVVKVRSLSSYPATANFGSPTALAIADFARPVALSAGSDSALDEDGDANDISADTVLTVGFSEDVRLGPGNGAGDWLVPDATLASTGGTSFSADGDDEVDIRVSGVTTSNDWSQGDRINVAANLGALTVADDGSGTSYAYFVDYTAATPTLRKVVV